MAENNEKVMTLWEHLEELRWVIFKILILVLSLTGISFIFINDILAILMKPLAILMEKSQVQLNQASPFDGVMIKMKVGILAGIIASFPFIILLLWSFILPALKEKERKSFWGIFFSILFFFVSGIIAGYFLLGIMMPIMVSFSVPGSQNLWRLRDYIDFTFLWLLGSGIVFQLPLLIFALVKLGILEIQTLKKYRKHAFLVAFILAAVLTPSPDVVTQLIVGTPIYLLYEMGIIIACFEKKRER